LPQFSDTFIILCLKYVFACLPSLYTHLREYGRYTLLLHQQDDTGNSTCSLLLQNSPPDSDLRKWIRQFSEHLYCFCAEFH